MYLITVREAVSFGHSCQRERDAWRKRQATQPSADARRLGQVAEAYASGWLAGRVGDDLTPEDREALRELTWVFGLEYEHAAWLYATERAVSRTGYARAWEDALRARGYA